MLIIVLIRRGGFLRYADGAFDPVSHVAVWFYCFSSVYSTQRMAQRTVGILDVSSGHLAL